MSQANQNRVSTLIEALPYIQRFHDKIIVVKCGGNAMIDEQTQKHFARDIVLLKQIGFHPVIIHGGGPSITEQLDQAGVEHRFVHGIRITSQRAMKIVDHCLHDINKDLCNLISSFGGNPLSLANGERVVRAQKLVLAEQADEDFGQTGTVAHIQENFASCAKDKAIPVLSPVGQDDHGTLYNINADHVAASISFALSAEKLILMTNTLGLLDADDKLVKNLLAQTAQDWIEQGIIQGGMIPKVRCAFDAIDGGVRAVHIIDGRKQHALLLELLTDGGVGTLITKN